MSSTVVVAGVVALAWAVSVVVHLTGDERDLATVSAAPAAVAAAVAVGADRDIAWTLCFGACLVPAAALLVELSVPAGALGRTGRRGAVAAVALAGVVSGVVLLVAGGRPSAIVVAAASAAVVVAGLPAFHARARLARGVARERADLVVAAALVAAAVALVAGALRVLSEFAGAAEVSIAAAGVLVALGVAGGRAASVRQRADLLLAAAVTTCSLAVAMAIALAVSVLALGRFPNRDEHRAMAVAVLAAGVAALAFRPLRARAVPAFTRLARGDRRPPEDVVRTFVERASQGVPDDELLLQLVESLRRTLGLRGAEIWTGTGGRLERVVSLPTRPPAALEVSGAALPILTQARVVGPAWLDLWLPEVLDGRDGQQLRVAPAAHSGALLGLVVAERSADDDAFSGEDDRALGELGRRLGVVLDNVQLNSTLRRTLDDLRTTNDELRASRSRLVAAADAERRRIERDLHDGAQQHLVALAVNLRLARDILADDPVSAGEILDQLGTDVRDTIQQVRELAHGIYPPLLMQSGLEEALRAAVARSPLAVTVDAAGVGRHDTEVETAVYFCCLEALQNAAKHAPASAVTITLRSGEDGLSFDVVDDGPGFDPASTAMGQGFQNMTDRLGAIRGTLRWEAAPGAGTRIHGHVPAGER